METIKNILTKNYKIILIVLVGLLMLYWLSSVLTSNSTMSQSDKMKIDSLTKVIGQINKTQDSLESKIEGINEEVQKLDGNILDIKTEKNKKGKKSHEEIIRVDKYTEPELDKFFSDRYK
jgi:peptidoglycan hydrolase CwlO-like protein